MKNDKIPDLLYLDDFGSVNGITVSNNSFKGYSPHRHVFYEFDYIVEGEGECEINGEKYFFKAGDVSFLTPKDLHSYKSEEYIKTVTVHFNLSNLSNELWGLSELKACTVQCSDEMKSAFMSFSMEKEEKDFKYIAYRNLLERITVLFLRMNKITLNKKIPMGIIDAIDFINRNFGRKITLDEVCDVCCYSQAHFCRQFKKYVGMSFVEYLTDIRISNARNIFMSHNISVTDLSYECGFGSVRSFNRAFLKKYGCSPVEYKEQHWKNNR